LISDAGSGSRTPEPEETTDSRTKQQAALAELSQFALQGGEFSVLLDNSIGLTAEVLQLGFCGVLEVLPSRNEFVLRAGLGWEPGYIGVATFPIERKFQAGYTFLTQQRVVVEDYASDTPFTPSPILKDHNIRSGMTVQIPGHDAPYGVLGAFSSMPREFDLDDVNFLRSVANVIATAIQRKRVEDAVRNSEVYFRGLLESAPDGIAILDAKSCIQLVNKESERLFGYQRSELIGRRIDVLIPERYRKYHSIYLNTYFSDPRVRPMGVGLELFGLRKDGSEFPVEISLSPMTTEEGTVVTAAIRDISERKKTEAEIRKLNGQLEEALRRSERLAATGRLAASLAHEINNPLASLNDILFVLNSQPDLTNDSKMLLQSAKKEVDRMVNIARETLAPHRNSGERLNVQVSDLLDASLESFRRQIEQTGVRVERHYQKNSLVSVIPGELRQVFTNLISNAIDAMPQGGLLNLEVIPEGQDVKVVVSDTGSGISREKLEEIFEPFFTTKGEHGLGIGLWISRNIVEKLGGSIHVRSTTGEASHGTHFTVCLPAVHPARASQTGLRLVS